VGDEEQHRNNEFHRSSSAASRRLRQARRSELFLERDLFFERAVRPGKVHVDRKAAMGGRHLVAAKEPAQRRMPRAGRRESRSGILLRRGVEGVSACPRPSRILGQHGVSSSAISRREEDNSMNSSLMERRIAANTA
jgi:hypothetical protein